MLVPNWTAMGPFFVQSRTPSQLSAGSGGRKRRAPSQGAP